MGNKFIGVAIALVIGVIAIPVITGALDTTRSPATTVCATQANTTGTYTLTGTDYVHEFDGTFYCSKSATAPTSTPTGSGSIQPIVASALPLSDFPGADSLLVIIPLAVVGGLLWYAMKSMTGGGGKG